MKNGKKLASPVFFQIFTGSVNPESRGFQVASSPDMADIITYHFLLKDQYINFSYILYPCDENSFPTSYHTIENGFVHTVTTAIRCLCLLFMTAR